MIQKTRFTSILVTAATAIALALGGTAALPNGPAHSLVAAAAAPHPVPQQVLPPDTDTPGQTPAAYLETALAWIQTYSLHTADVDWPSVRAEAVRQAQDATTVADTYPAIRWVLHQLGDHHSRFLDPATAQQVQAGETRGLGMLVMPPNYVVVRVDSGGPAEQAGVEVGDLLVAIDGQPVAVAAGAGPANKPSVQLTLQRVGLAAPFTVTLAPGVSSGTGTPQGHRVAGTLGYVEVPQVLGSDSDHETAVATQLQQVVAAVDHAPTCGWVVDLRRNTGGNMWPMLAGIGPLLGEGGLGAFVDATGHQASWTYAQGQSLLDGQALTTVPMPYVLQHPQPPVAVLTSRLTGSSGEAVVVAFRGRPDTRSFGEPTAGVPTANRANTLSDGAVIVLTVARDVDRTGQPYDDRISPDEPVAADWTAFGSDHDPVLQAAVTWLQQQPACSGSAPS